VNDVLFASFMVRTGNFLPSALVLLTVIMAATLARRYTAAFSQIEGLLSDKDTYLKEMHHRVKNSLQIVASVAGLQANRVPDPGTRGLFQAMRERIRSVALVHEKLHASLSGDDIDLGGYARDLVAQVASSHGSGFAVNPPPVEIGDGVGSAPIELCVDLGLALTELLVNAYKHAGGPVRVSLSMADGRLSVRVDDAGPGFPPGADPQTGESLGFKIVSSVVKRRGGDIRIFSESGGSVLLEIPVVRSTEQKKQHKGKIDGQ
jgi:two-component sensor histidine kinase